MDKVKKKILLDVIDFIGFSCLILTSFFILCLFIVIAPRVLEIEVGKGDIIFFTIIISGAMNYILYRIVLIPNRKFQRNI
ncbi:MAG TPA: hypothetical protein ENG87_05595 [Candidatus Pacearchaeota archaeon]|nr:hypothetical protein [Candidatus Pacearchaeota archaeon]HDZ60194.1 hypothetical protein [Candidatus Pacearchaeota archaeon]